MVVENNRRVGESNPTVIAHGLPFIRRSPEQQVSPSANGKRPCRGLGHRSKGTAHQLIKRQAKASYCGRSELRTDAFIIGIKSSICPSENLNSVN